MNGSSLTTAPEIAAYLTAHVLGIAVAYGVNPIIFAALVAAGYQTRIPAVAFGISITIMSLVLFLFLVLRSLFGGGRPQS
jgi:hypothetical protein